MQATVTYEAQSQIITSLLQHSFVLRQRAIVRISKAEGLDLRADKMNLKRCDYKS